MTGTANQNIAEFKTSSFKFEARAGNPGAIINNYLREIEKWGDLLWCSDIIPFARAKVNEWTMNVEVKDYDITDSNRRENELMIIKSIKEFGKKHPKVSYILLDQSCDVFGYKTFTSGTWKYFEDNNEWKVLTFDDLYDSIKCGDNFIWRLGDILFTADPSDYKSALACVVLDAFCDRLIPANHNKTMTKVTEEGFCLLYNWLHRIISPNVVGYISTSSYYRDFDQKNCVPLIPKTWKESDIEFLNINKLQAISRKIIEESSEEDSDDKEEDSTKNSGKSGNNTESGNEYIENAMDYVKREISKGDEDFSKDDGDLPMSMKLSNIIDERSLFYHQLWGEEYIVEIDTDLTISGIILSQSDMLFALCSYGYLEILVEDKALLDRKKFEKSVEEKYGVHCSVYFINEDQGKNLLKQGGNIQ